MTAGASPGFPPLAGRRADPALLAAAMAAYLLCFALWLPPTHGVEDEAGFLNQALVWSKGAVSAEGAGFETLPDFIPVKGRHVAWRNPGRSLFAMPFVAAGAREGVFWSGAAIHLATAGAAALLLFRMGLSPLWAALVLGHPTLAIYSRTVMGDEAAGLFLTLAAAAALSPRNPGFKTGLFIGLAALMRYQAGAVLPFAALAFALGANERNRREALACLAAGGATGAAILAYNLTLLDHPLGYTGQGAFGLDFLPRNLAFYPLALMLLWPCMALGPFFDRAPGAGVRLAAALPLPAMFLFYYYYDKGPDLPRTLVLGQRLIQPALPVLAAAYASALERAAAGGPALLRHPRLRPAAAAGLFFLALAVPPPLFRAHQAHLRELAAARDEMVRLVPAGSSVITCGSGLRKLFAVPWPGLPAYQWVVIDAFAPDGESQPRVAARDSGEGFAAFLPKYPGEPPPGACASWLAARNPEAVGTSTRLRLYRISPDDPPPPSLK